MNVASVDNLVVRIMLVAAHKFSHWTAEFSLNVQ